jgi:hypothetical protein
MLARPVRIAAPDKQEFSSQAAAFGAGAMPAQP